MKATKRRELPKKTPTLTFLLNKSLFTANAPLGFVFMFLVVLECVVQLVKGTYVYFEILGTVVAFTAQCVLTQACFQVSPVYLILHIAGRANGKLAFANHRIEPEMAAIDEVVVGECNFASEIYLFPVFCLPPFWCLSLGQDLLRHAC